ncbi:helix-turn-helix transcriptional regulator [Acrocarpospora pleiomorpha]|uniref:helix-turn-helix transcriptional regulator n=1 Tax=Acrocarpospora pleiomorpha TaxID=90975 RepID=UPI0012D3653C|nr:YafY family protein [Acrocarpospora pleiomorpha]
MTTNRVLTLLELLQARPGLTGPELAARLEVDERTIRRYVARLTDLGVPVQADRGRYGGYRLLPGFKLPPLMLSEDEATAVVLGLLVGRHNGVALGTESALAKIERVLPKALGERVRAISETVGLAFHRPASPPLPPSALLSLADATRRRRRVQMRYRSFRGAPTTRDLDPYGLVLHSARWYVTGFDHLRQELRTFRADRVISVDLLEETFAPPDDFNAVTHVLDSLAGVPFRHEVEVVLHAPLEEVRRRVPPSVGSLTEIGSGVRLVARAERLDGMAQMLAGLGWSFAVVRPDKLRVEVLALADRLRGFVHES